MQYVLISSGTHAVRLLWKQEKLRLQWAVSQKILTPLVILSMEKTMVTKVISQLKFISRLKIFRETGPRTSTDIPNLSQKCYFIS